MFYVASRHLLFTTLQFLFAEFDTFPLVTMKCELQIGDGGECIYDDDNNVDNDAKRLKRMLLKVYNIAIF